MSSTIFSGLSSLRWCVCVSHGCLRNHVCEWEMQCTLAHPWASAVTSVRLALSLALHTYLRMIHTHMHVCMYRYMFFFWVHFYEYVWGWLCLAPNCTRFTYCFTRKARTHTHAHTHAHTHTRRPCDGGESETDCFLPPSHRDLSLRGNMLTSLPEGLFGGLSALRSVDIQGLA
jgi:hypothetical protein